MDNRAQLFCPSWYGQAFTLLKKNLFILNFWAAFIFLQIILRVVQLFLRGEIIWTYFVDLYKMALLNSMKDELA